MTTLGGPAGNGGAGGAAGAGGSGGNGFSVATNPGHNDYYFYYMYGLERAGRMANVRWFGQHDWYRRGAQQLVQMLQI